MRVNGQVITEPGYRVTSRDRVSLDGIDLSLEKEKVYLILNKPSLVISSAHDPEGRTTVMDLVQESFPQRLFPVGRLDYLSTGLMFITNDGEFANRIGHPRAECIKRYVVKSKVNIPRIMLENWQRGVRIMNVRYCLKEFHYEGAKSVILSLIEGKNREIRNVFEHYKIPVISLHRIQFGTQSLGTLKAGKFRTLSHNDITDLLENAKNKQETHKKAI